MAKRNANTNLNRDNWDEEVEPEEVGLFKRASEDEIKKRVIKTARRRGLASGEEGSTKNIFSGFSGFKSSTNGSQNETKASPFSFLSKITTEKTDLSSASNTKPMFSFGSGATTTAKSEDSETITISDDEKSNSMKPAAGKEENGTEYHGKLKDLNVALLQWITKHVNENPICILTPIFNDYENHLKKINAHKTNKKSDASSASKSVSSLGTANTTNFGEFSFSSLKPTQTSATSPNNSSTLTFNKTTSPTTDPKLPSIFNLSNNSANTLTENKSSEKLSGIFSSATPTGTFNFNPNQAFNSSKPFTFANVTAPASSSKPEEEEAAAKEDDEPPKVEFTPVVENDSVFSKRCKVFIKKDGKFSDRGVGTFHIKPIKDSSKIQLLVRADTNLGNILLNTLLTASMPVQKMKKNNILIICIPTPDSEPKTPTSVLIRVQNEEQVDELLEQIKKHTPKAD